MSSSLNLEYTGQGVGRQVRPCLKAAPVHAAGSSWIGRTCSPCPCRPCDTPRGRSGVAGRPQRRPSSANAAGIAPVCALGTFPRARAASKDGDALAPALFAFGQHDVFQQVADALHPDNSPVAFLDDLYVVAMPSRARAALDATGRTVAEQCGTASNLGKTRASLLKRALRTGQ